MASNKGVPISPEDIPALQKSIIKEEKKKIPAKIFDCFNQLLAQNFKEGRSVIPLSDVKMLIEQTIRDQPFQNFWLSVEPFYRDAGWNVVYEEPHYGDQDFFPYYEFTPK